MPQDCDIKRPVKFSDTTYSNYFSGLMCVDKRKSCPSWASQGDCKTNGWTERNCRISCKTRCDTHPVKPTGKQSFHAECNPRMIYFGNI